MEISIIIPLYNVEQYVKRCIDSVVCQTFNDYEVILVDDASPDSSLAIAEGILAENGVSYLSIKQSTNRGPSAARNSGLDMAKGKYVVFIDGDDALTDNNVLETFHSTIEREKVDMVVGNFDYLYEDGQRERFEHFSKRAGRIEVDEFADKYFSHKFHSSAWGRIIDRDFLLRNRLRFEEGIIYEDYYWLFDICVVGCSCYLLPESYYLYYRGNRDSLTATVNASFVDGLVDTLEAFVSSCSKRDIDSDKIELYVIFLSLSATDMLGRSVVGCSKSEWRAAYRRIARIYRSSVFWKYKKMCTLPSWLAYIVFVESGKRYKFKGHWYYWRLMNALNRYNWEI